MFRRKTFKKLLFGASVLSLVFISACSEKKKDKDNTPKTPATVNAPSPLPPVAGTPGSVPPSVYNDYNDNYNQSEQPKNSGFPSYTGNSDPSTWGGCGVGIYCDSGNGGYSIPVDFSSKIAGFDAEDIRACMVAANNNGIPTYGPWRVSAARIVTGAGQELTYGEPNVNSSNESRIVMLNVKAYVSSSEVDLTGQNTVYCVKSESYLSTLKYRSCYPNNVIFLKDKEWISANKYVVPYSCNQGPFYY